MSGSDPTLSQTSWQVEADLLARGREWLEKRCNTLRIRHLYPGGPDLGVLMLAYQRLHHAELTGRVRPARRERWFRRALRRELRHNVATRQRRLAWHLPRPRTPARGLLHDRLVQQSLRRVDADSRGRVSARLAGDVHGPATPPEKRGLRQFRQAFANACLADPASLRRVPPDAFVYLTGRLPRRIRHPIARLFLFKLPLYLWGGVAAALVLAYVLAFVLLNGPLLGQLITRVASGYIDGEISFGAIHWRLRLVADLVTGTPSPIHVENVEVWEPFKSAGKKRSRRFMHAPELDVEMVLHDIVPWNRLGVPAVFEIPWYLHFTEVEAPADAPLKVQIREFADPLPDAAPDATAMNLLAAFRLYGDTPSKPGDRPLSYWIEDARLSKVDLELDFAYAADWIALADLRDVHLSLRHDGPPAPDPDAPEEVTELPLRFTATADAPRGAVRIAGIDVPLRHARIDKLDAGVTADLGDLAFHLTTEAGESPLALAGQLYGAFMSGPQDATPSPNVDLLVSTTSPAGILATVTPQLGLDATTVVADEGTLTAQVVGSLDKPRYDLSVEGADITIDPADPNWTVRDASIGVVLERRPVPQRWAKAVEGERWVAAVDTARGTIFGGTMREDPARDTHAILPDGDEPWRLALGTDLKRADPAKAWPSVADFLGGSVDGKLELDRLVLASGEREGETAGALNELEITFRQTRLTRRNGPAQDGLPKIWTADGLLHIGDDGAFSTRGLGLIVDGARLDVRGGVDGEFSHVRGTDLELEVTDGTGFSHAFDLPPYFVELAAKLSVGGPTVALSSPARGQLRVTGLGRGRERGGTTLAQIWMDRGTLRLQSANTAVFGGTGDVDLELQLASGGKWLDEPRVRARADLRGTDLARVVGEPFAGGADLVVELDDGNGGLAPLSKFRLRGAAHSPELALGETRFRDARANFELRDDAVELREVSLPYHRPISPFHAPRSTIAVGELRASGTLGLDPGVDSELQVTARGIPLSAVAGAFGYNTDARGQLARGTSLTIGGDLRRPDASGKVVMRGLRVSGVDLGGGTLELATADLERTDTAEAHRRISLRGQLGHGKGPSWDVDVRTAFPVEDSSAVSASAELSFPSVELDELFADPEVADRFRSLSGGLRDVAARVTTCNADHPTLPACAERTPGHADFGLELSAGQVWFGKAGRSHQDVCGAGHGVCSATPLRAELDGDQLILLEPWVLRTRETGEPNDLRIAGAFDLSTGAEPRACGDAGRDDDVHATLAGRIDLSAYAPALVALGVERAAGVLDVDAAIIGPLSDPALVGHASLPPGAPTVLLKHESSDLRVDFPELRLQADGTGLAAEGTLRLRGQPLRFGQMHGRRSRVELFGQCAGKFELAAQGGVSAQLLVELADLDVVDAEGSGELLQAWVAGGPDQETGFGGVFEADRGLRIQPTDGVSSVELRRGRVAFERCEMVSTDAPLCGGREPGSLALWIGGSGRAGSLSPRQPSDALAVGLGDRGSANLWGYAVIDPSLSAFRDVGLGLVLEDAPYRSRDSQGRPEMDVRLSSPRIEVVGASPLYVRGQVLVEEAVWLRDAAGVEFLSFFDDDLDSLSEAPLPELIRNTQLQLAVRTNAPLRVDNNVARDVAAQANLRVTGTAEAPEVSGRIDLEPGGTLDIPFLSSTYRVQEGRVVIERTLDDALVDITTLREEPVYINDEPQYVKLKLGGTLSAITWRCLTQGEGARAIESTRACVNYLVLGAGDQRNNSPQVERRATGLIDSTRPLSLVGSVTEFDISERLADASPRTRAYLPDTLMRLGQSGVELSLATPKRWLDFDYGHATFGFDYVRGYPGSLLRDDREFSLRVKLLEPITLDFAQSSRSYLNERIIFDPLDQTSLELRLDLRIPTLR